MLLLCVSLFDIKKLCVLCVITYVINLAIAITAVDFKNGGFVKSFKQSVSDFIGGVKQYTIAFVCVVLAAAAVLSYTAASNILTPQVTRINQYKEFTQAKTNKYKVSGNILGSENPALVVNVYSDYRCPICSAHNIMIHKLAKELGNIQIVHYNLPLDRDCNVYLQHQMHPGACMLAKYELAAEKQGKLWDINTIFFDKQPKTEADVLKLAAGLGLDVKQLEQDAHSVEVMQKLSAEIDDAYKKSINGTPTMVIGNEVYIGIKPYNEFKKTILEHMPRGQ
jgi:protein-disulfide isomerase